MTTTHKTLAAVFLLMSGSPLVGCHGDCSDQKEAAREFVEKPSNRTCNTNDDCQVISTGCNEIRGAFCGQSQVNQSAADSAEWKSIEAAADECDDDCAVCQGLLVATCLDGFCGGP